MKTLSCLTCILVCTLMFFSCHHRESKRKLNEAEIARVTWKMTEIMVHDVTNPPLAARFYSYACIAAYELQYESNHRLRSLQGFLNAYPSMQVLPAHFTGDIKLACLLAMMEMAGKLQPSGTRMGAYETQFMDSCLHAGYSDESLQASLLTARASVKAVLAYAKADRYNRISNFQRYSPSEKEGSWFPTPPAYMAPVEPYFNTVRPFTLDSAAQFKPKPPVAYSSKSGSPFLKLMQLNVARSAERLKPAEQEIAAFWDCNPFAVQDNGHMLIGLKKISPGAHWLGIACQLCRQKNVSFEKALEIQTLLSITLMDSFLACWDEKYRSNRIRPETAIRKLLDPAWRPLLQTPPFPEYLSGHSCVSASSAIILSHYFGTKCSFTDSVERDYGLKPRTFTSFDEAAREAGISRFYGGIHFMDAIENGQIQGRQVGLWVLQKFGSKP